LKLERVADGSIIERVLHGDANSFNLLVWQWEKPIYNYIVRLIGYRDEAMDLCQHTFMTPFRELGTLKDRDHFSPCLYRIAHNTCFSRLRKEKGKYHVPIEPETKSTTTSPEKRLAVEKALKTLPEDQREVVILKVFNDLKFEEIAAIQGAPVSTVKSRLYMGFEKLRSILE